MDVNAKCKRNILWFWTIWYITPLTWQYKFEETLRSDGNGASCVSSRFTYTDDDMLEAAGVCACFICLFMYLVKSYGLHSQYWLKSVIGELESSDLH